MKICSFPNCGRPLKSKGLCQSHYIQQRAGEALRPIQEQRRAPVRDCEYPGCGRLGNYKGLCQPHRRQQQRGEELQPVRGDFRECTFPGCERQVNSKGLCMTHARQRSRGIELKPIHVPSHRYDHGGYVLLKDPEHPNSNKNGNVLEHVKVMSEILGRPLHPEETVHHINGVKDDNRPENLELWASMHPKGQRVKDLLEFAREIIARYERTN